MPKPNLMTPEFKLRTEAHEVNSINIHPPLAVSGIHL